MNVNQNNSIIYCDNKSSIKLLLAEKRKRCKSCLVLFSYWGARDLCTKIPGTDPLLREGFDVICVQSNCNDWHQNIADKGIDKLRCVLKEEYTYAKGYGSSMGGFGAIFYSQILGLNSVLALSPQFKISKDFDNRWYKFNENIVWKQTMEMAKEYAGLIHLIYDPMDLDSKHGEAIKNNFKRATVLCHKIKFASHPTTNYFNDSDVLKQLLLSFAKDGFQIPKVKKKYNKTYLRALSHQLSKNSNRCRWAKNIMLMGIELGDEGHSALRHVSNLSYRLKEIDDAILFAKKAVDAKDNNEVSLAAHKEHLKNMLSMLS